jgi:hypothetical protein
LLPFVRNSLTVRSPQNAEMRHRSAPTFEALLSATRRLVGWKGALPVGHGVGSLLGGLVLEHGLCWLRKRIGSPLADLLLHAAELLATLLTDNSLGLALAGLGAFFRVRALLAPPRLAA